MKLPRNSALTFAFLTALISGFSVFYNKLVVVNGIDATVFNIIKNGGVALCFTLFLFTRGKFSTLTKLTRSEWIKLIAIAGVGGSIPFILFFEGLKTVPAATGNILNKSLFIWVALLAVPFLAEKIKPMKIVGYVLLALGLFFAVPAFRLTGSRGEFFIFTATLLWAIEVILAKKVLKTVDSSIVAWARMAIGTMFLLVIALAQGKVSQLMHISQAQWLAILPSILFLTGYVASWLVALKKAEATVVTSVLTLAPVITTILSLLFIPKSSSIQIAAVLLPIVGVVVVLFATRPTKAPSIEQ